MDPRDHWRQVYETKQPGEVSWFQDSPSPSLEALDRIDANPSQSLVDIGAGASVLADALLDRGWSDITLVDIAEPALDAVRRRLGARADQAHWEIADIRHWRPTRTYDIWHDRAVFHFLTTPDERQAYRRALLAGTHPGSHVIVATFALDGPDKCSGLPVHRYDAAGLSAELGDDFVPVADWIETHITPWGSDQRFQWAVFRRA
ncbi:class I SAM-dependent methyltransferase [Sphingomonas alba]|uniref:Class I SAM-dependent methyltransferase n=1 Tax=Sphingomonas alba TaxID=2908208 RepID=A0ABT0RNI6_9SPHN|nr:class I SAM-dependent methyltransferase [Sphingomonas alba]MCL6684219.1 class I SAM-dependent methyltransferase [Sphingomonas alba]